MLVDAAQPMRVGGDFRAAMGKALRSAVKSVVRPDKRAPALRSEEEDTLSMQLIPVPPDRIAALWPLIHPFAEQMAERFPDDWPPHELRRRAESGLMLLWLVRPPESETPSGLVGTELHAKPSGRRGLVIAFAAGSDHRRALAVMPELERYGASLGCDFIEIRGRSGWGRHLEDYRVTPGVVLKKELT